MKHLLTLFVLIFLGTFLSAQAPTGIKYQAVLKGADGLPLTDRLVSLRFSALDQSDALVYSETHALMTGDQGLIHVNIGEGTPQMGSFAAIPWEGGEVSFRVEMDPDGGTNYSLSGEEQFQSVPYALFADMAGELADHAVVDPSQISSGGAGTGQVLKWNGQQWVPADDLGDGGGGGDYIAGPGISIVNNVITNTGDINPDDDITNISQAGGDLSGTFFNLQIKPGAVGSDEIAPGAINSTHIQLNSINETHIQGGTFPHSLPPNGPAAGDLTGSYPAPVVRGLNGIPIATQQPADGQVLKFNASIGQWQPNTDLVSTGGGAVNVSSRLFGDGSPGLPLDIASQGAQAGQVLKWNGSSWSPANDDSGSGAPSGPAGGSLAGTYPNPTIATDAIGTQNIQNNAVVNEKIANATLQFQKIAQNNAGIGQVIKWNGTAWTPANDNTGTGEPTGPAGGDLTGTYPNPQVANNAIGTLKLADAAVATTKLADQSVTSGKLANASVTGAKIAQQGASNGQVLKWNGSSWAPANDEMGSSTPTGPAGGDLSGTYPNPQIANSAIVTTKLSDGAVTSIKLGDQSVTSSKLVDESVTNGKLANAAVTGSKIAQQGATSGQVLKWNGTTWAPANDEMGAGGGGAPTGPAGGDLTGTYPSPTIANNAITNTKIMNSAVTGRKIDQMGATLGQFLMWSDTAWVAGNVPTGGGTPSGPAGGDLGGTYPNPIVTRLQGRNVSSSAPSNGQVLQWTTGGEWAPASVGGGLTLPFAGTSNNNGASFNITQTFGGGIAGNNLTAIRGAYSSNVGLIGTPTYAGDFTGDVRVSEGNLIVSKSGNGSALQLTNTGGRVWEIRNQGTLRMGVDGQDIIILNYPSGFLNPPGMRPFLDNVLQLGTINSRWTAVYATNGTINTSDRNLKHHILPISYGLSTIRAMKPYSYKWKDGSDDRTHLGLMAQDLQELIPEAVYKDEGVETLGVAYVELIPVMIKAIQELSTKVEVLEQALIAAETAAIQSGMKE